MFESWEIFEPHKTGKMAHGSTLAELVNGDIIVAWYSGKSEKNASVGIYSSTLKKSTNQWTDTRLIEKKDYRSTEGNPVLYFDKEMGRLWLFWVTVNKMVKIGGEWRFGGWSKGLVKCKHSLDNGYTWTRPRYLTKTWGWMIRNKPMKLSNGIFILPAYIELFNYFSTDLRCSSNSFAKGAIESKWNKGTKIPRGIMQPTIIELSKGHLLAFHRTTRAGPYGGHIAKTESLDYGKRWTKPVKTSLPNPNSGCDMVKLDNGTLVLAFNNSSKNRNDLSIGFSKDTGNSWYIKLVENEKGQRFSYPAIIEASDGTIYCTYTNKRKNIKCIHFDEDWLLHIN